MSDLSPASALAPGTILAGKFRVIRCLGQGGMGAVYEIEHELTKHRRALKLLHANMAAMPGVVERFLREASAAGHVGNPHIVESFDAGRLDTGEPYLVLEMLRGQTLTERIAGGPMPLAQLVDLVGQACDGIQAAHDAGIVHRDLKPDNLFVTETNGRPFVKILDFGISKFDPAKTGGNQLTQEGAALGTPYYMSPEQVLGKADIDARTDVYALGVILYECAAGARPFEAETLPQLVVLIHEGRPPRLSERRPDLPRDFVELVHRAMARDRTERVQSAEELRAALERFGAISVNTHLPVSRSTAPAPPTEAPVAIGHRGGGQSAVDARSALDQAGLGTSAAGISVRAVSSKKKTPLGVIVGGAIAVAIVVGVGLFAAGGLRRSDSTESATQESAAASPLPQGPPSSVIAPLDPESEPSAVSSEAASSQPAPRVAPSNRAASTAAPSARTTAPPAHRLRRAEESGLAKENPFK